MGQSSALGISSFFFSSFFTDTDVLVPAMAVARESAAIVLLFLAMVDALVTALIFVLLCLCRDTSTVRSAATTAATAEAEGAASGGVPLVRYRDPCRCRSYCLLVLGLNSADNTWQFGSLGFGKEPEVTCSTDDCAYRTKPRRRRYSNMRVLAKARVMQKTFCEVPHKQSRELK